MFQATTAQPGTEAKLCVLETRRENGEPLWHEDDNVDKPERGVILTPGHRDLLTAARDWEPAEAADWEDECETEEGDE